MIVGKNYPRTDEFLEYSAQMEDFRGLNYLAIDRRLDSEIAALERRC
jgi:hypothetical protein